MESRSGSNQGPSAYQPGALPQGHTGSQSSECLYVFLYGRWWAGGGEWGQEEVIGSQTFTLSSWRTKDTADTENAESSKCVCVSVCRPGRVGGDWGEGG